MKFDKIRVARDPETFSDVLRDLAKDDDPAVRAAVAENPSTPEDVLEALAEDPNWIVRAAVARNKNAPPSALIKLASDDDFMVLLSLVGNPNLPTEAIRRLIERGYTTLRISLLNRRLPREIYENPVDEDFKRLLASSQYTPPDILDRFADDPDPQVRRILASNPAIGQETIRELVRYEDPLILTSLALRRDLPKDIMEQLVGKGPEVRAVLAENLSIPPDIQTTLARDEDPRVRRSLAFNPHLCREAMELLLEDRSLHTALVLHPRVTPDILRRLAESPDPEVRAAVAMNPRTPEDVLRKLTGDADTKVSTAAKIVLKRREDLKRLVGSSAA